MADNLIFPIGFDLEAAVKKAESEGASAMKRLENTFSRQPLVLKTDTSGFEELGQSAEVLKTRLKEIKGQWDKMPTSVKFDLDSEGKVKQLTAEGKALWDELLRINTALQGVSMGIQQMARESQRQLDAENKAEQKRKQVIASSLRAEYKRIEAKKQAEAASKRELQLLNQQYAAEERRQRLASSQASIAKRQQVIKTLRAEENTIVNITAKLQHWQQVMNSSAMDGRQFKRATEEVQRLSQKLSDAQTRISQLTATTSNASVRQSAAVKQVSQEFKHQDGYVSRLLKRLAVYASFQYASQFLTNIREVTAQFELQRVSLGAIIQDQQRANQLFAEIKSFALTSPLKILDLTKYTKQVAAYGIETEKLFGTTKMLADISVGLGVSLDRLALFYGQVFATGYLRASEVRQATEAGIPLVDKLAKKLSEANGKLVTAADVMDLISKRAISFEQVEEVFQDMTSAGGEFYNMQVKQSQTLFGMWSKLGDAAAIMYDQIGNTSSINAGMKLAIRSIEQMMRNWKTTARVLDSVAVAMAVYVVGLKNAAVASKSLTAAESLALLTTKERIIATPKLVAAIVGQNVATKLSTNLTIAHTGAMMRAATATTVLSKGFWKLTAALLANPWVAAASAIALVGTALFHFIGNTETAAERAEKLNNSVASLKKLEDTTTPLIDTYNELINKTERTAEEQKKLSEVTYELAKQYPGAITAIGNFGAEVELAADKLNQLYQTEKQARMENTRNELQETEKQIASTEARIAQLQEYLSEGKMWGGGQSGVMVAMSDEERGRVLAQIDELRYGADGQSGLFGLQQSAEAARRALGLIPSEAAQAVEKFGAWKKTMSGFGKYIATEIENNFTRIRRIKLFDDSTVAQFGSLEEALDAAAKKYKEAAESVEKHNKTLERGAAGLGQEQFDKISAERDEAQAMKELSEEALNYYNAMALLLKAMGGGRSGQSDPRLGILQEMASTLKQVNKEYDELAKKEGATKALADTQDKYANTFKYLQSLATKYKFKLPDFGVPTDAASLTKYLDAVREAMKKLPKSEKAVLSLETDIADINMADAQKKIEAELKRLSDRIARTKTAKEFYEKILSTTGNVDMAINLTTSIFGENGQDLNKQIALQINELMQSGEGGIEIGLDVIGDDYNINYKNLRKLTEEAYKAKKIGDQAYKDLIAIAANGEKDVSKMVDGWLKATEKAKSYSDKLLDLARTTNAEIAKIEAQRTAGNITDDYAKAQIQGYKDKQAQEIAKLQYEAFKDSPMYVQMFDDLDNASTTMLRNMKQRIEELKTSWKDLTPTQLKEMQSRLNEIDAQLAKRNPFKGLIDGIKEYRKLRKGGDTLGNKSEGAAEKALDAAAKARLEAEKEYLEILNKEGAAQEEIADAKKRFDDAAADEDAAAKALENWKKVKDAIGLSANELFQMLNWAGDIAKGIADISEAMGADEEDVQYWNDVADALGQISGGIQDIVSAAMSGNVTGIISSTLTAIPKMFVGFSNLFSAGKVRKANKEIKRQQELLEQLEYTYSRLESAADKVFGRDYLNNYNQQLKNLQAQQQAYLKQAEAERSKGKKKDKDKIKEYEEAARETADKIKELQDDLVAHFTGSSKTDVARQMAKSWINARASMSDTFAAIKGDYADLIKNMIVEGAAARVIENALSPLWEQIEEAYKSNNPEEALEKALEGADSFYEAANNGMEVLWKALEARGYDMKKLIGDTDSEYTGIAKSVAGATSEEINNVAAIGNTLMYYVSPIPRIDENLARVVAIMEGRAAALPTASGVTSGAVDYTEMFNTANQHLSSLPRMEQHLAEIHTMLGRALKTKGSTTGFNTFLNS